MVELPNSLEGTLEGAKNTLEKGNMLTQAPEGNPTSAFAPKEMPKASYKLPHAARKVNRPMTGINQSTF